MDKLKKILQHHPDNCRGMPDTPKSSMTAESPLSSPRDAGHAESPLSSPRESSSELALAPYPEDPDEQADSFACPRAADPHEPLENLEEASDDDQNHTRFPWFTNDAIANQIC